MTLPAFIRRLRGIEDRPLKPYELETLTLIRAQSRRLRWRSTDSLYQAYREWSTSCYCAGWMAPSTYYTDRFLDWVEEDPTDAD